MKLIIFFYTKQKDLQNCLKLDLAYFRAEQQFMYAYTGLNFGMLQRSCLYFKSKFFKIVFYYSILRGLASIGTGLNLNVTKLLNCMVLNGLMISTKHQSNNSWNLTWIWYMSDKCCSWILGIGLLFLVTYLPLLSSVQIRGIPRLRELRWYRGGSGKTYCLTICLLVLRPSASWCKVLSL